MLMQINQWWLALEQRERKLLKLMGGFLAAVIFYVAIYSPIMNAQRQTEQALQNAQQQWQWLNDQTPRLQQYGSSSIGAKADIKTAGELVSLLQKTLRSQNLFKDVKTLKEITNGAEVSFDDVQTSRVFRWLGALEQQGVIADKLQMTRLQEDQAKVKVQFKL